MKRAFDYLAETLKDAAEGREIVYIPNPGNRGDALIRYGTKLFFADHGIAHTEVNIGGRHGKAHLLPYLSPTYGRPVLFVYGGGGAWSRAYDGGYRVCRLLSRFTRHIFVLPSTFERPPDLPPGMHFRRDEAESRDAAPRSEFCHDMAFYAVLHRDQLGFGTLPVTVPRGVFFRTDREARFADALPGDNYDISAAGGHMDLADKFVRELAAHREIFTDRLHVAIGSLIARRPVRLMAGNYFKIRAIYASSMTPDYADEVTLAPDSVGIAEWLAENETKAERL